jgi:hypothetical protein
LSAPPRNTATFRKGYFAGDLSATCLLWLTVVVLQQDTAPSPLAAWMILPWAPAAKEVGP